MEFMKYKYKQIGHRIQTLRNSKGLTQEDFSTAEDDIPTIQANVLSAIENGEIYKGNTSFLTNGNISRLSFELNLTAAEIIFGNDEEVETLVRELFYQVVTNIRPEFVTQRFPEYLSKAITDVSNIVSGIFSQRKNERKLVLTEMLQAFKISNSNFSDELNPATQSIFHAMRWVAPLSSVMNAKKIDGKKYYFLDYRLLELYGIYDYYLPSHDEKSNLYFTYFAYSKLLWEAAREKLVHSFKNVVIPDKSKITFLKLDGLIKKWLLNSFVDDIKETENKFKNNELLQIGYEVFDLSRAIIRIISDSELMKEINNKDLIEIEYRPLIWQNRDMNFNLFKDARTLSANWDFTVYHSEDHDKELEEEHIGKGWNERTIKERVRVSDLYDYDSYRKIFEKYKEDGKYVVIPKLLTGQRFISDKIKLDALISQVRYLTVMQSAYLTLWDKDEFFNYFNLD